jgi:hypothetical protein
MLSPRRAPAFISSIEAVMVFDFISAGLGVGDGWRIPGSELGGRLALELLGDEEIDGEVAGEDGRFRDRLEIIGSIDIKRGFGGVKWAMSMVSTMLIFVVQVVVGDIVVGRVRVDDTVYDIEPFSKSKELGRPPSNFPTGTNVNLNPNS